MRVLSGNMNSILHQSRCKTKVIESQTAAALSLFRAVVVHVVDFRSDARTWCVSNMAIVVDSLSRPRQRRARPGPSQIRASAEHHRRLRHQSTDIFVRRPVPTAVGPKESQEPKEAWGSSAVYLALHSRLSVRNAHLKIGCYNQLGPFPSVSHASFS